MRDGEGTVDNVPIDEKRRTITGTCYLELDDELHISAYNVILDGLMK